MVVQEQRPLRFEQPDDRSLTLAKVAALWNEIHLRSLSIQAGLLARQQIQELTKYSRPFGTTGDVSRVTSQFSSVG